MQALPTGEKTGTSVFAQIDTLGGTILYQLFTNLFMDSEDFFVLESRSLSDVSSRLGSVWLSTHRGLSACCSASCGFFESCGRLL